MQLDIAAGHSWVWSALRRGLALGCILIGPSFWLSSAAAAERSACAAIPLRTANLNPFHLLYGIPGSHGVCGLTSGSTEFIASTNIASRLKGVVSGSEWLFADGETHRHALAMRHGFGNGWEALLEVSAVSQNAGVLDGFIENWHSFFGLPQGSRDTEPRDRLEILYVREGIARITIYDSASSLGDIALGIGRIVGRGSLSNDGLALRGAVKLPTGDQDALGGSGGLSASIWAETSGRLFGSAASHDWLYSATLGGLVGDSPETLSEIGEQFIAFGRFGITWKVSPRLALKAQMDGNSSPYSASSLAPLTDPFVMISVGGTLRITPNAVLEMAIAEDDGSHRSAPDFGVHVAIRWTR